MRGRDRQHTQIPLNQTFAPVDAARLIESSPPLQRQTLWELIEPESGGEVLQHLSGEIQSDFLRQMDIKERGAATGFFDDDDRADLIPK